MKKTLLALLLLSSALFADLGYDVFKNKCESCHIEMVTPEEKKAQMHTFKAPPMVEISTRLKENIKTTDEEEDVDRYLFILFVKDYIMNPNDQMTMCEPGAIERFGIMPSQKGKLNEKETEAIAIWLFDRYEETE